MLHWDDAPDAVYQELPLPENRLAICNRDISVGGVEHDEAGFNFRPFGECILSDAPADLYVMR